MKRIAIVGSARPDASEEGVWEKMLAAARAVLPPPGEECTLVSGGSAYADHVAVKLFLEKRVQGLTLYLPCKFGTDDAFEDNGQKGFVVNPGWVMNKVHSDFSKAIDRNTRGEIGLAQTNGAVLIVNPEGLHARNTDIATKCDMLIALGTTPTPTSGTLDTYSKCPVEKKYINVMAPSAEERRAVKRSAQVMSQWLAVKKTKPAAV